MEELKKETNKNSENINKVKDDDDEESIEEIWNRK